MSTASLPAPVDVRSSESEPATAPATWLPEDTAAPAGRAETRVVSPGRTGPAGARTPPITPGGGLSRRSDLLQGLAARAAGQPCRFLSASERAELREFAHLCEITLYRPGRLLDRIRKSSSSDAGYNEAEALFERLRLISLALRAVEQDMEESPRFVDGTLPLRPQCRAEHHDGPFVVDRKSAAAGERDDD